MICEHCQKAGDFNWLINTGTAPVELTEALMKQAAMRHGLCASSTGCDCQHKLGKYIQPFPAS